MADAPYQPLPLLSEPLSARASGSDGSDCGLRRSLKSGVVDGRVHETPMQSQEPICVGPDHLLDQLEAYFKPDSVVATTSSQDVIPLSPSSTKTQRMPLYAHLQITNAKSIDTNNDTFEMKVRLYLMWEVDLSTRADVAEWRHKATESSHGYYALDSEEVQVFDEIMQVPSVSFSNAVAKEAADVLGIRVYRRVTDSDLDTIMHNQAYHMTFQQKFNVNQLPFDTHMLELQLELDCGRTWNKFHLTVCTVAFYKDVKHVSQFDVLAPTIKLETSSALTHRRKNIVIPVARQWMYYFHSIASVFAILSFYAQLVFCCGIEDVGDRLALIVTLFLTVVAFKFTLDLPKVDYVTTLDSYMLQMMGALCLSGIFATVAQKMVNLHARGLLPEYFEWLAEEEGGYYLDLWMAVLNGVVSAGVHITFLLRALWYQHSHSSVCYVEGRNFLVYQFAEPFFLPARNQIRSDAPGSSGTSSTSQGS